MVTLVGIGMSEAVAMADAPPSGPSAVAVSDASEFLAAIQGGKLLGLPPLPAAAAGAAATYSSPEFWSNYVHEALTNKLILLPLPIDVVKPDVILPHAPISSGGYVSALPESPVDLRGVSYQWAGKTKTVGDFLADTGTDALEFVHNGSLVGDYFAGGWSPEHAHQAWSTTKSFVSTLVGVALDHHLIASLDDPIETYLPELAGTGWQGTTVRNLLEMRSGVQWDEHTEELEQNDQVLEWVDLALDYYSNGQLGKTRDDFLKSLPRVEPQGVRFNYNSANTQVLAWLVESLYHKPFNDVLSEQLWQPAGMEAPADIMTDRTGAAVASEALFARPRDFARFGELMRNGGRTPEGHQVVSRNWVTAATTGMKPAMDAGDAAPGGYGYQWWSGATPDGFQASGFQGQYVTVSPSACLTGVRLAHTLQFSTEGKFAGQGNDEWHTLYRAVLDRLGGCH
ncbi:6-aminohexanoate-dimer hydrolase [Nocardia cerradoensis]|uniref:6-aminohexanoate-dimer hydrolase n=2 Tax=Nocardia cerradoensis TaxID=85688 RepID=A0A231GU73_9NOCA|nr:6-aminohexanoate-dimer hydrolase [Nocardia cerradoensis]